MTTRITYTNSGIDFTGIKKFVLVDLNGNCIATGKQVVDTKNGQDFTSVHIGVLVNTNGQKLF